MPKNPPQPPDTRLPPSLIDNSPDFLPGEVDNLPEANKEAMLTQIPLARLGAPEEIAAVVGFLASDAAGYITGETIHVNGGMYMA